MISKLWRRFESVERASRRVTVHSFVCTEWCYFFCSACPRSGSEYVDRMNSVINAKSSTAIMGAGVTEDQFGAKK